MYNNGVSHHTVKDDISGVIKVFEWLSYIPKHKGASLPIGPMTDPISRPIDFMPTKAPYDPRNMIAGTTIDGTWISGFFDKGSWVECLDNWAKTVITGRARLGGIPMGVICPETRSVKFTLSYLSPPHKREILMPLTSYVYCSVVPYFLMYSLVQVDRM